MQECFNNANCEWSILEEIYTDYKDNYYDKFQKTSIKLAEKLSKEKPEDIHAIYGRAKNPEHLIEKIIRKKGSEHRSAYENITKDNYKDIVTDLVGIRILMLAKEEWKVVHKHIEKQFDEFYQGTPVAYVCYGDRELFETDLIKVDYTNKGYRSQHYIVRYENVYCEIQVRTLAEEVYGEFDHRVRYPYRVNNKFLIRYGKIVSKCTSELDDLVSTCLALGEESWNELHQCVEEDSYVDWKKRPVNESDSEFSEDEEKEDIQPVKVEDVIAKVFVRK